MKIRELLRDYPGFFSPWGQHSPGWKMIPLWIRSRRTVTVVIGVLLAIGATQNYVLGVYRVPSASMKNTLLVGDIFVANKLAYGLQTPPWIGLPGLGIGARLPSATLIEGPDPQRGDVIIFRHPERLGAVYVKRVIGLPGDTIHIERKRVLVNGEEIPPPPNARLTFARFFYPDLKDPAIWPPDAGNRDFYGPVTVPEGHLFVLGDNRDSSVDSRFWGFLPESLVLGKVEVIVLSRGYDTDSLTERKHFRPERVGRWVF